MRQVDNNHGAGFSIADLENERERARLAFGEQLQEVTQAGTRAARRLVMPALWGAVLVGGAVAVFGLVRLVRRRQRAQAFIRVMVEPARAEQSLARTAGAALARLAIERLLAAASSAAGAKAFTASVSGEPPEALGSPRPARLDSSGVQGKSTLNGRQETLG